VPVLVINEDRDTAEAETPCRGTQGIEIAWSRHRRSSGGVCGV